MSLRQELHRLCYNHIAARINDVHAAMAQVHDAMANETKSSAGDKYETGREMLQQELNLHQANLNELNKIKAVLDHTSTAAVTDTIGQGSIVHTSRGNYYMAAGAGAFQYNGKKYHTISPASPIGKAMTGLSAKDAFSFKNLQYNILEVL